MGRFGVVFRISPPLPLLVVDVLVACVDPLSAECADGCWWVLVAAQSVAAGVAWFEACRVELEFGVLRDWVKVVEVEAVIACVLRC